MEDIAQAAYNPTDTAVKGPVVGRPLTTLYPSYPQQLIVPVEESAQAESSPTDTAAKVPVVGAPLIC